MRKFEEIALLLTEKYTSFMFNPSRYEHKYGIQLLDDLHNVFPELLYDGVAFSTTPVVPFLQRRIELLFPEEYVGSRAHYRLFQEARRRRDIPAPSPSFIPASQLLSPLGSSPAASSPVHPVSHIHTQPPPPPPPPEENNTSVPPPPARTVRTPIVQTLRRGTSSLRFPIGDMFGGLGSILGNLGGGLDEYWTTGVGSLGGGLGNIRVSLNTTAGFQTADDMSPVPVVPTADEIRDATVLTSLEPAHDVICAICQDHGQPQDAPTHEWRIIRHCSHRFHKHCVDRWFEQKVFCPVCRFDIREHENNTAADMD